MSRLRVAPIVEGEGEVECIRILLERIWSDMIGGEYVDVLRPTRTSRTKLARRLDSGELRIDLEEVAEVVGKASKKLLEKRSDDFVIPELVLILIDADEDCPKTKALGLGPELLDVAKKAVEKRSDRTGVACVIANVEYETWFVAAAESLRDKGYLSLPDEFQPILEPESQRAGKNWIIKRFNRKETQDLRNPQSYKETRDQPAMTDAMNLSLCRARSPSFDKLCRELGKFVAKTSEQKKN